MSGEYGSSSATVFAASPNEYEVWHYHHRKQYVSCSPSLSFFFLNCSLKFAQLQDVLFRINCLFTWQKPIVQDSFPIPLDSQHDFLRIKNLLLSWINLAHVTQSRMIFAEIFFTQIMWYRNIVRFEYPNFIQLFMEGGF